MKWPIKNFYLLLLIFAIVSCSSHSHYRYHHHKRYHYHKRDNKRARKLPPVTDGWRQKAASRNAYIVQKKDTLYSIAWAFGYDYRELAKSNNIKPPYILRCGQHIYIVSPKHQIPVFKPLLIHSHVKSAEVIPKGWSWPVSGKIAAAFSNKLGGNKGIDITGNYGGPVLASNAGKVVYSGIGIRSYGQLIIIKHSDDYLSAYAYNSKMLVHEGQWVKTGQKIATIGRDDFGNVRLHFEIRKIGKPVNPLLYLPPKS